MAVNLGKEDELKGYDTIKMGSEEFWKLKLLDQEEFLERDGADF